MKIDAIHELAAASMLCCIIIISGDHRACDISDSTLMCIVISGYTVLRLGWITLCSWCESCYNVLLGCIVLLVIRDHCIVSYEFAR